jgi:mannose-6-phosphate isomerase-like protein (cupin superfamily)
MSDRPKSSDRPWRLVEAGSMASWSGLVVQIPQGPSLKGKGFLAGRLGLTGMEVSVNAMSPGHSVPFSHAHKQNEELYLFLSGSGEMLLDGQVIRVRAGTAVQIERPVLRCWRNTGNVSLTCIVVQAKAGSLEQATRTDGIVAPELPAWP